MYPKFLSFCLDIRAPPTNMWPANLEHTVQQKQHEEHSLDRLEGESQLLKAVLWPLYVL